MCFAAKFGAKTKIVKTNFVKKAKMAKFGTKNALFGYFWDRIFKSYCHISNDHPRICQIAKFRRKMKMPKFGTNSVLFGYFWVRI